jgi:hypothetical protein
MRLVSCGERAPVAAFGADHDEHRRGTQPQAHPGGKQESGQVHASPPSPADQGWAQTARAQPSSSLCI